MASLEKDIALYLEDQSVGTVGSDIFISQWSEKAPDECILVQETGGEGQHLYVKLQTVSIAFVARSKTFEGAAEKIDALRDLFDNRTKFSLGANRKFIMYFYTADARLDLGKNINGLFEQSQGYVVRYREYESGDTI